MRGSQLLLGLMLASSFSARLPAGTIRDDRSAQAYVSLAQQYPSVGRVDSLTSAGELIGSGTLIGPQFVLTAGHLVDNLTSMEFSVGGNTYAATHWLANPGWNGNLATGYDLAVVELNAPVSNVAAAIRYDGSSELNSLGTFVGFGLTGTGLTGATTFDGLPRAGTNMVDGLYAGNPRILTADFDNPHNVAASSQGSAVPTNLEYLIAPGDSGGGLFINTSLGPELAGVNSFGAAPDGRFNASYSDISGDVRVSLFNGWIDQAIDQLLAVGAYGELPLVGVPEPSGVWLAVCGAAYTWLGTRQRRHRSLGAQRS